MISSESFFRLLSREDVYDTVSKSNCEVILRPLISNDNINATWLLRFIEDINFEPTKDIIRGKDRIKLEMESAKAIQEYEFSSNPDIRRVEKKLRSVGRILSNSGVDVESLFKKYDMRNSGMIRKSDFIDVLSKSGLYILEKGSNIESRTADSVHAKQKFQIQKIKGISCGVQLRSNQVAFSHDSKSLEEFDDHSESISLINWYRQGQKRLLLQRILSHSLATSINIHPR